MSLRRQKINVLGLTLIFVQVQKLMFNLEYFTIILYLGFNITYTLIREGFGLYKNDAICLKYLLKLSQNYLTDLGWWVLI